MERDDSYGDLANACRTHAPLVAFVLGSGMGPVVERWGRLCSVRFENLPGMVPSGVHGHRGRLSLVAISSHAALVWEGRLHFYEGHPWERVTLPTRITAALGVRAMLHTNAAGGIRDDLVPGTLMAITDHLEMTPPNWWRHAEPGSRPSPYSLGLLAALRAGALASGIDLKEGRYASLTGPSYETAAEIRALRHWGADAVGMSTAREIHAGVEAGMECGAVSCITNRACGLSDSPLCHEEVVAVAATQREVIAALLETFLPIAAWRP